MRNVEPKRSEPGAACSIRRVHAKPVDESGRPHHVDFAARCRHGEPAVESDCLGADKVLKKALVYVGSFGHDHNARDPGDAVRVLLECRIPEILRIMLLATGKVYFGCCRVICESKRKTDLHDRAVRLFAFAFKMQLVRARDVT